MPGFYSAIQLLLLLLLLLLLVGVALPAVVLPRPPSSPKFVRRDYAPSLVGPPKESAEKVSYQQSTNVEKPDTQDYRFVEIELHDGDNVESLDLHGLVQAVLDNQQQASPLPSQRRLDFAAEREEEEDAEEEKEAELAGQHQPRLNMTYPQPEVVPHSILGVRDVGLGPSQRVFEASSPQAHYLLRPKSFGDEKLYYLKSSRPKVYVNFRGRTGNFRQQDGPDSRLTMRLEPAAFLRSTQPYRAAQQQDNGVAKSPKRPPKKFDPAAHESGRAASSRTTSAATTENTMVTSSELPKQIPAPPSRIPSRSPIVHTTPVQRFTARRTDILPGYAFAEP